MRPTATHDGTVTGSLHGDIHKMGIHVDATGHIMNVLTDLYSDRVLAFVREYSTNAWDAHLEAGVSRPIEITLPTALSPFYKIRDFGTGLDVKDIAEIYSQYGASTKRQSDLFNGTLGLGCKSALTYTSQFSVTSVKDGVKHETSVSRMADGTGEMEVIESISTTEHNGVVITIPIKRNDVYDVANKVEEFFTFWEPGMVLVNGKEPKHTKGREVAPNLYMVDGLNKDLIVMGNVAYPVPDGYDIWETEDDRYGYNRRNFGVVFYAQMGEVTFAPSREKLATNDNTIKTIERVRANFKAHLVASLQAEVTSATTYQSAWAKSIEIKSRYRQVTLPDFTYRGEVIPQKVDAPKVPGQTYDAMTGKYVAGMVNSDWYTYNASGGQGHSSTDSLNASHQFVLVLNSPSSAPTTHQKSKMRRAYDNDLLPGVRLVLVDKHPDKKWLGDSTTVDWSVIRDIKMTAPKVKAALEEFGVLQSSGAVYDEIIDKSEKIAYVSPRFWRDESHWRRAGYHKAMSAAGWKVIELGENRHAKFQRENPHTMPLNLAAQKVYNNYIDGLTTQDRVVLSTDSEDVSLAKNLFSVLVDIDDPSVVDFITKVNGCDRDATVSVNDAMRNLVHNFGGTAKDFTATAPFKNYPLLHNSGYNSKRSATTAHHAMLYINAVHNS